MHFYVACVYHQQFKPGLVNQQFQQIFPYSFIAPTAESPMCVFPIPITRRQVSPRRSGAQNPENSVDESPIVPRISAPSAFASRQMRFHVLPQLI
jgi:hypothetical protein